MKTFWTIVASISSLLLIVGATLFYMGYSKERPAGLLVTTSPVSNVYINGLSMGKSPYRGTAKSGQIALKLVPDDPSLIPFETRITLTPGIETVARREFGKSEDLSSGDIITFEKESGGGATLIVISTPDNAQVSIDGVSKGFAPFKSSTIAPAEHSISVKSPGYMDRLMSLKTLKGYRLTVFAKLAKTAEAVLAASAIPSPTPAPKTFVQILNTPTGFLRMRTEPGTKGEEIAELKPGQKYLYLDTDEASGWLKIQYQDPAPGLPNGIVGWVSGQYAKKIETTH